MVLFKFSHLLFCEVVLIRRWALERKRIVRILRLSFMINILMSIVPIRETRLIRTCLLCRGITLFSSFNYFCLWLNLKRFICYFICCRKFHFMRIDDFMFFFRVESLFLGYNKTLIIFWMKLLLIIGVHCLWIRIFHKSIWTSSSSSNWLTTCWIYYIINI